MAGGKSGVDDRLGLWEGEVGNGGCIEALVLGCVGGSACRSYKKQWYVSNQASHVVNKMSELFASLEQLGVTQLVVTPGMSTYMGQAI